jgi:hypothetical protein
VHDSLYNNYNHIVPKNIDKIILLNEKIYDNINNDKVLQVNINKRLTYLDCIKYANQKLKRSPASCSQVRQVV